MTIKVILICHCNAHEGFIQDSISGGEISTPGACHCTFSLAKITLLRTAQWPQLNTKNNTKLLKVKIVKKITAYCHKHVYKTCEILGGGN